MCELSTPPEPSVTPVAVLVRPAAVSGPAALLFSPESGEASAAAARRQGALGTGHGQGGEGADMAGAWGETQSSTYGIWIDRKDTEE